MKMWKIDLLNEVKSHWEEEVYSWTLITTKLNLINFEFKKHKFKMSRALEFVQK